MPKNLRRCEHWLAEPRCKIIAVSEKRRIPVFIPTDHSRLRTEEATSGWLSSAPIDESLDVSFDLAASEGQFCELFGQMCIKCEILKRKM